MGPQIWGTNARKSRPGAWSGDMTSERVRKRQFGRESTFLTRCAYEIWRLFIHDDHLWVHAFPARPRLDAYRRRHRSNYPTRDCLPIPSRWPPTPAHGHQNPAFCGKCMSSSFFVSFTLTIQLPYRVRWQDLKDLFRAAGTVLRADVSLGPDNRSRGYGTVLLATAEDAGRAVDMFNGYTWQSRVLEVRLDRLMPDLDVPSRSFEDLGAPATYSGVHDLASYRTLFVGNVRSPLSYLSR